MVNSKHAFWQALIFAIIVFSIGLIMGFFLEQNRTEKIELNLLNSEINLLDEQIRSRAIENLKINCEISKSNMIAFADKIYEEAILLEEYDQSAKFSDNLKILHKRYDLLRVLLWLESVQFKEKCEDEIHNVVYIFEYNTEDLTQKATQASISRLLSDIKQKHGNKIILIPIAGNLDISSVNTILEKYKINSLPAIIIDEEKIIYGLPTFEELENKIFND